MHRAEVDKKEKENKKKVRDMGENGKKQTKK